MASDTSNKLAKEKICVKLWYNQKVEHLLS